MMQRLTEPSTHAGVAAILAAIIPALPPHWQMIAQGLAMVLGGGAVVLRERSGR